jgi:hypothetical protein
VDEALLERLVALVVEAKVLRHPFDVDDCCHYSSSAKFPSSRPKTRMAARSPRTEIAARTPMRPRYVVTGHVGKTVKIE